MTSTWVLLLVLLMEISLVQAENLPSFGFPTAQSMLEAQFDSLTESSDVISSSRQLSTTTLNGAGDASGYAYYQFFSGHGCSGMMTYTTGVPAGVCLASNEYNFPDEYYSYAYIITNRTYQSFYITNIQENCKNTAVIFYLDESCQTPIRVQMLNQNNDQNSNHSFTSCYDNHHPASNMVNSYIGKCSVGSQIPASTTSYVYSEYNSTDRCNVAPLSFETYTVDVCFGNSNLSSMSFSCSNDGDNITMSQYYDSKVCVPNTVYGLQTNLTITAGCFSGSTSQDKYSFKKTQCLIVESSSEKNSLSTAAIVGIVIGSVAVVALIAFLAAYFVFGVGVAASASGGNIENDKNPILHDQA